MAHRQQRDFCLRIMRKHKEYFKSKHVLDVGSLDINGNNKFLFENCIYLGIDVGEGPNVDVVCPAHLYSGSFDTIVSTEALEHDMHYEKSLLNIVEMLKPNGMLLITCATTGRAEHGTRRSHPETAPLLMKQEGDWCDWYKNITEEDFRKVLDVDAIFKEYAFEVDGTSCDLYFYGIKR